MKTLILLRHAKSSWKDAGRPDLDRPLSRRGRREAPRVGRHLCQRGLVPELFLSSTARRARKTAALVAKKCGYEGPIELNADLYAADPATCLAVLRDLYHDAERVIVVGHNPGLEELLTVLTGTRAKLPTAALAVIELEIDRWQALTAHTPGTLVELWKPR